MESTIIRTVISSQMESVFDAQHENFSVKNFTLIGGLKENEEVIDSKKYKYEIKIRHAEETNGGELFDSAIKEIQQVKTNPLKDNNMSNESKLKTFYSIRVVHAENHEEAIEKAIEGEFIEDANICDKVLTGSELMESLPEFDQYKKESVKWGINDFLEMEKPTGYRKITKEQAQEALERMIYKHDAEYGIGWHTLNYYYTEFATEIDVERTIDGVDIPGASIVFSGILEDHMLVDIGALSISREGREFILDTDKTKTNNEKGFTEIEITLVKDESMFKDCPYDITKQDLGSDDVKVSLYVGGEYEYEIEHITLFVRFHNEDGTHSTKAINVTQE